MELFYKKAQLFIKVISLFSIGLFVFGCSLPEAITIPKVWLKQVTVSAQKDANKELVTVVHFVFPKTEDLYKEFKKMDALAYFAAIDQLITDYPNDLEVVPIEIVPGMTLTKEIHLKDFSSQAVLIFARYDDSIPGMHREELKKMCKKAHVSLGRNSFSVSY